MRLPGYRVPILVNDYEWAVDDDLRRVCERYDALLFEKVGLKDVLPIRERPLHGPDRDYAFMAHFDFVITDRAGEALLAVEFDGGRHRTDPQQIIRDDRKNRICDEFLLPLIRAGAPSLHRPDHRSLLEWLIEVFFVGQRLWDQRERYEESGGEADPPEIPPGDFDYREFGKLFKRGLTVGGPLDAFAEARAKVSQFYWRRPVQQPTFEGWYADDPQGHTVGHLALEVEPGRWIVSTGRCDLKHAAIWLDGILTPKLAQDLALLGLARQLDLWERGTGRTMSTSELEELVAGVEQGLFSWPNLPSQREQANSILGVLRDWGRDVDDPRVRYKVYESLQRDDESDEDHHDRVIERERDFPDGW